VIDVRKNSDGFSTVRFIDGDYQNTNSRAKLSKSNKSSSPKVLFMSHNDLFDFILATFLE